MAVSRVCIVYEPRLYTDLLTRLFQSLRHLDVVNVPISHLFGPHNRETWEKWVDVIIIASDENNAPDLGALPQLVPGAKIIAFSPSGDFGLIRLPGTSLWEEVRPFGIDQLILEVQKGRQSTYRSV